MHRDSNPDFDATAYFVAEWQAHERANPVPIDPPSRTKPPSPNPVGFMTLVWLYFWRSLTQQSRRPVVLLLNNMMVFVSAFFLALVYYGVSSLALDFKV